MTAASARPAAPASRTAACSGAGATTVDVTEPYWKIIREGAIQEKEIGGVFAGYVSCLGRPLNPKKLQFGGLKPQNLAITVFGGALNARFLRDARGLRVRCQPGGGGLPRSEARDFAQTGVARLHSQP